MTKHGPWLIHRLKAGKTLATFANRTAGPFLHIATYSVRVVRYIRPSGKGKSAWKRTSRDIHTADSWLKAVDLHIISQQGRECPPPLIQGCPLWLHQRPQTVSATYINRHTVTAWSLYSAQVYEEGSAMLKEKPLIFPSLAGWTGIHLLYTWWIGIHVKMPWTDVITTSRGLAWWLIQ